MSVATADTLLSHYALDTATVCTATGSFLEYLGVASVKSRIHGLTHTSIHSRTHTHTHARKQHTHTYIRKHTHTYVRTHTPHTHTYVRTHTHKSTYTHIYTRTDNSWCRTFTTVLRSCSVDILSRSTFLII